MQKSTLCDRKIVMLHAQEVAINKTKDSTEKHLR